jgi:4-amino-4-deoxy-L-arabinose transferase-like glycosyltransferase
LPARQGGPGILADRAVFWSALALALFAALFTLFMTLGSKKFDRYLLPVFAPLDLLAGIGLWSGASWLAERAGDRSARYLLPGVLGLAIVLQAGMALQTFPYYLDYYNPLLGGGERAPEVMMIGWGEGIDQAARYLNAKPQAEQLKVIAWYPDGVFSYFFNGETVHAEPEWEQTEPLLRQSDYAVTYIHQWQRGLPFPEMLELLSGQVPEQTIILNGIEYAQVYDLSGLGGQ